MTRASIFSICAEGNSDPVTNASDLRVTEAGNHRIILTYVPEQETIIVTGVDALPYAAFEENKAAA